jgi:hypothetical protein
MSRRKTIAHSAINSTSKLSKTKGTKTRRDTYEINKNNCCNRMQLLRERRCF